MGDNRDNSMDSRSFGVVKGDSIVGKVEAVVFSLDIVDTFLPVRIDRFSMDFLIYRFRIRQTSSNYSGLQLM